MTIASKGQQRAGDLAVASSGEQAKTTSTPSAVCPHCSEPLSLGLVARAEAESSLTYKITPKPGCLIDIETIGGTLNALSKLLKSVGKDMSTNTTVLLKNATTHDNGEIQFDVLIARVERMQKSNPTGATARSQDNSRTLPRLK